MTITEARHAMAALSPTTRPAAGSTAAHGEPMRLVDAMSRFEPTWVEAVAVVQAVCARLLPGEAAPALDTITIAPSGAVSFPPAGIADDITTVAAMGRLLNGILRTGDCPMPVWEATERARRAPAAVGTARNFGAALTCFPAAQGAQELRKYFEAAQRLAPLTARPATASFSATGLTVRAVCVLLMVAMGGIGAGMSVGALVAAKALGARPVPMMMATHQAGR